ncbi:MAG: adenine deaminase, partial [Oscillospiraceae bacterium]|nr:adenine deaminase [Oscillospiraceae bacterium]
EMMNFVGVVGSDPEVISKIVAAQAHHKKIDGHAPGLAGKDLAAYIAAGVYSDHECSDMEDAMNKLRNGQFIMVRDGTAARNLDALVDLLKQPYYDRCMFCTDDKHPSDLLEKGHIDYIIKKAIGLGVDPIVAVKTACHNPARYFALNNRGAIAPGYLADFAVIDNFENFNVELVFKKGVLTCKNGEVQPFETPRIEEYLNDRAHDTFHLAHLTAEDFRDVRPRGVIGLVPGEIISTDNGYASAVELERDILKIAVIERHKNTHHIGLGYIQGYGLRSGAVATSISHDSHNIIVVGTNEEDMAFAANRIVENCGGITVVENGKVLGEVVLEIAGLMSDESLVAVNNKLEDAKEQAFRLGVSRGIDPFMTLSFMSLPVIPTLRLTTRGVIDVIKQQYI